MRWRQGRRSDNVEDRRDEPARGGFNFPFPGRGGGMRFPGAGMGGRRGGMSGIGLIVVIVLFLLFGGDLGSLLQQMPAGSGVDPLPRSQTGEIGESPRSKPGDELADFTSVVLADTEDSWRPIFAQIGRQYSDPTLVLFSGAVRSACGFAQSAVGPFYCPRDQKLYIDLAFFNELRTRFGAPGDFAQAYVVAHEVGHHVQTLLGISDKVRSAQAGASRTDANAIQVRMELQADCFAGIWANHGDRARGILEDGDVEEALTAASAIGDDRLQRQAQGHVVPDAFTHGTSRQRMVWFRRGLESGELTSCDTFGADRL